ncbi:GerAB/ArcD/ProY family transporter [Sutcliffiella halmapala]|uniref:GerAB/ArcD/ProY family transporter n=1 Tax=Sutcliffiella halmapala TaxID=79882 RepID=UPI000995B38F|nr:GerAB/ArcD/ProY family transporter [Sutcliffiella halmapala]
MMVKDKAISLHQLYFLIVKTQIGVGVLSLPNSVYSVSKNDSWISVLIAGIFVQVILYLIWKTDKLTNGFDLLVLTKSYFGKFFGTLLQLLYLGYFVIIGTIILILYNSVMKTWVYTFTPKLIIIGLFILVSSYLVAGGLQAVAKFYVIASILIIVLIICVGIAFKEAHFVYLFPIGINGLTEIVKGAKECVLAMLGFELCFMFISYTKGTSKEKLKTLTFANITVTLLYTFIVITNIVFYSPEELKIVPEPVLYMMKEYTFIVLERVDLLFLSVWIIVVITTFCSYLYCAAETLEHLISSHWKKLKSSYYILIVGFCMFLLTMIPANQIKIAKMSSLVGEISIWFVTAVPTIFFILTIIKMKRKKRGSNESQL